VMESVIHQQLQPQQYDDIQPSLEQQYDDIQPSLEFAVSEDYVRLRCRILRLCI
jgi:hypothetical protein